MYDFIIVCLLKEKDLVVSGGMTWWKDFICVACYNIIGQRDEVKTRFPYPQLQPNSQFLCSIVTIKLEVIIKIYCRHSRKTKYM